MEVVNKITAFVNGGLEYVNDNKILSSVLGLFLVLYAALAAPKLPKSVTAWFDNTWFKLGFMFLIAYMATKDPSVAIISAVALLVTLQTLSAQKTADAVVNAVSNTVQTRVQSMRERFSQEINEKDAVLEAQLEAIKQANEQAIRQIEEEANRAAGASLEIASPPNYNNDIEQFDNEYQNEEVLYEGMDEGTFDEMDQETYGDMQQRIYEQMTQEMEQEMEEDTAQEMARENNVSEEENIRVNVSNEVMASAVDESAQLYGDASELNNNSNNTRRNDSNSSSYDNTCAESTSELLSGFDGSELAGAAF
jgi:hypothetical protein